MLALMHFVPIIVSTRDAILILHGEYFSHQPTPLAFIHGAGLQAATLGALLVYLQLRGWKTSDFAMHASWRGMARAVVLVILMLSGSRIVGVMLHDAQNVLPLPRMPFAPLRSHYHPRQIITSPFWRWAILFVSMVINACKEEVTYLAYGFSQLAVRRGPTLAMGVTLLLRMLCHTYHGIYALQNLATFVVVSIWYWRTRNLWTVITAHTLFDLIVTFEKGAP